MFVANDSKEDSRYVGQIESLEEAVYGGLPFAAFATNLLGENHDNGSLAEYWDHIYGGHQDESGEEGSRYIGLFSGIRPPDEDMEPGQPNTKRLQKVEEEYYLYPQEVGKAVRWVTKESLKGREVYCGAHLLTHRQRKKENAAPITALYADGDGAVIPEGMPQPTLTVESSPGRYQYFWRLTRSLPPEKAEELNKRLTDAIGADKGGYDLTQLLRPPGTKNHKYGATPLVKLTEIREGEAYDPDELDRVLPSTGKSAESEYEAQTDNSPGEQEGKHLVEPPVLLGDITESCGSEIP